MTRLRGQGRDPRATGDPCSKPGRLGSKWWGKAGSSGPAPNAAQMARQGRVEPSAHVQSDFHPGGRGNFVGPITDPPPDNPRATRGAAPLPRTVAASWQGLGTGCGQSGWGIVWARCGKREDIASSALHPRAWLGSARRPPASVSGRSSGDPGVRECRAPTGF